MLPVIIKVSYIAILASDVGLPVGITLYGAGIISLLARPIRRKVSKILKKKKKSIKLLIQSKLIQDEYIMSNELCIERGKYCKNIANLRLILEAKLTSL